MIYHQVCNKRNTIGATCGTWTVTLPEHARPSLLFSGIHVAHSSVFCGVLCQSFFRSMRGHPCYSVSFTLLILQFSVECYVNHSSGACEAIPVIQWCSRCSFFSFLCSVMSIIASLFVLFLCIVCYSLKCHTPFPYLQTFHEKLSILKYFA